MLIGVFMGVREGKPQACSYVSGIDHSTWASELEPLEIVIAARALVPPQFQALRIASDCLNIVNTFNELLDYCRGTTTTSRT
jgi:hypothetical protein